MGLLDNDSRSVYEDCEVFLEEVVTDRDGNTITRASSTPIPAKARFQMQGQSGTSARRAEQMDEGFFTERVYDVRFPRSFPHVLGAQAKIRYAGVMWSVFGDVMRYNSSPRTRHLIYTVRRS